MKKNNLQKKQKISNLLDFSGFIETFSGFRYFIYMKKSFLITILFSIFVFAASAQTKLSNQATKYLEDFLAFRVGVTEYHNDKTKAVNEINQYKSKNPYTGFTTQEKLVIDSFYLTEIYNYVYEIKSYDSSMKSQLTAQIEKNEAYINSNKGNVSEWLYLITSDCLSCYMSYSPVSGAIKYGMKVKTYYEECLAINSKNSVCLTHYAQWFYWAPAINGGSKKKTKTNLENAVACATTDGDKFYAEIYYSQILYDLGDKANAATHLAKAKAICPKSEFVKELETLNSKGYSIFSNNRMKSEEAGRVEKQ